MTTQAEIERHLAVVLVALMTLSVAAPTTVSADSSCSGEGDLYVAGGSLAQYDDGNPEPYEAMVDSVGGESQAELIIVPAASSEPTTSYESYKDDFNDAGVPNESIRLAELALKDDPNTDDIDESTWSDNYDNQSIADEINNSNIIWFTGGAQHRSVEMLLKDDNTTDTLVADAIRHQHECHAATIGGSSAGAAIQSDDMIGAGDGYGAMRDGVALNDTYGDDSDYRPWATEGMGFLDVGLVDQHFHERARLGRLVRVMAYENSTEHLERQNLGFGVGENTVLVFEGNSTRAHVIGENGVTIVDLSNATVSDYSADEDAVNITNVQIHYLTKYDAFDYGGGAGSLTFDIDTANKTRDTDQNPSYSGNKIESRWMENRLSVQLMTEDLIDNTETESIGDEAGDGTDYYAQGNKYVRVTYTQDAQSDGYYGEYDDGNGRYAVLRIHLDITNWDDSKGGGGAP